jgi:TatD DNase family protein
MILIDTHTHIYLEEFDKDRYEIIENAQKQGVNKMFLPNIDSSTIADMLNLAKKYPKIMFPMIGLHPTSVEEDYKHELQIIEKELETNKYYGIGEIGLDYYWDTNFKNEQIKVFEHQLHLAMENNLPAIIHIRDAFDDAIAIINKPEYSNLKGIFHCFTGTQEQAVNIINNGFKLGIGGIITFKNAGLDKVLKEIDIKHIVLETDAPYLAPVPKRGKRNEPAYIYYIAKKIAEIKKEDISKIAEITTQNAMEIFNL